MIKTESPKRPTHRVYAVSKNGEKSYWTEIGAAWSHRDGKGFNVSSIICRSTAQRSSSANRAPGRSLIIDAILEIRRLNDSFRRSLSGGSKRLVTAGIAALPPQDQAAILAKVIAFDAFTEDNDPHGEHGFGAFDHAGRRIFWKNDTYDQSLEFGSEDPADPAKTTRVLTIMLAEEY
jgi:hypothetical protein